MTGPVSGGGATGAPVRITATRTGEVLTITLAGDLDVASWAGVSIELHELLATVTGGQVHFDLSDVDFCDVVGLRVLMEAYRHAVARGGTCRIRNLPPYLHWLLRITDVATQLGLQSVPTAATCRHGQRRSGINIRESSLNQD